MKKPIFILLALPSTFYLQCLERSAARDIPGALRPTADNCSPEGSSRFAISNPNAVHGSRENDIARSISKNGLNYFYEALACHAHPKNQINYLNTLLEETTKQLAHLTSLKKKINPTQKEQNEEIEINLFMHKLDACALHVALILLQERSHPILNRV